MQKSIFDSIALEEWFSKNKRLFPWRLECNPYYVWISEVMLQQTRADVVIPYFLKWISLFPNIKILAKAKKQKVIKAWEGLGYYARARNLHVAAQQIEKKFNGKIPSLREDLLKIKGIGLYTSEAILAFAFHKKAAPMDTNVMRVLSRFFLIEKDIAKVCVKKEMWEIEKNILCKIRPWITAEALIELGSLICKKKPLCNTCPIKKNCKAFQKNRQLALPISSKRVSYVKLKRIVFILEKQKFILITKRKKGLLMEDLYEMPYLDFTKKFSEKELEEQIFLQFGFTAKYFCKLPIVYQSYTRFHIELFPYYFFVEGEKKGDDWQWKRKNQLKKLPFSSGHRKILEKLIYSEET